VSPQQPSPPSRPRDAEATRAALLRVARRRFTVLGYERTTTRDIAADAGVNVSLISRYFGSKDGLFAAVVEETSEALDEGADLAPDAIVDSMIASLAPEAWAEFGHVHPLLLLIRGAGAGEDRAAGLRQQALAGAIDRLEAAWTDPGIAPETARLRAELLFALFSGVTMLRSVVPGEPLAQHDEALLRSELGRLVRAIVGPGGE
jgi:AcrR family transcriptional regulator